MLIQRETPAEVEGTDTPDTTLATLVQWVESAEEEGSAMRERSERDRDYYDGRQITDEEAAILKARKQPVIAFNLVKGKVDYLLGLEKNQRTDPKAFPRNPGDEDTAHAATDAIRYVCDINDFKMIASATWESMVVEGAGGCEVVAEPSPSGETDVVVRPIPWDRMIWDPYSRKSDFSDAKFKGEVLWMDEAEVLARWPDSDQTVNLSYDKVSMTSAWDDRPRWSVWADAQRKRVRIARLYWRTSEDDWQYATFSRGGYLDPPQPSPFQDEYGRPMCPYEFQSAYVNRDNWRYGVVRDLIDPQDEINLRHRKAVHLLSVRQVIAEQGAVQDVDAARKELAKPDGYIEVAPGMRFEIQQTGDLSAGQASLLQEAKSVFQALGPNAAMLGKQGSSASGRAIALSQQGGAMEVGAILDLHRDWRKRVYRAIWDRVKQFWTAEKWVRVTDDERNVRFVGLNQQVVEIDPMTGQPAVTVKNDVAQMFVDIVVDHGTDIATLQIEEFQALADLASKGFPIPPDILIEASNLRSKGKILDRLRAAQQQGPGDNGAAAKMQAEMELKRAEAEAGLELKRAETEAEMAMRREEVQMRAAADREALMMKAEADRQRMQAELELKRQIAAEEAALKEREALRSAEIERMKVEGAQRETIETALAARHSEMTATVAQPIQAQIAQLGAALGQTAQALDSVAGRNESVAQLLETVASEIGAPREIVRGMDGKAIGVRVGNRVRPVRRGADGRPMGIE